MEQDFKWTLLYEGKKKLYTLTEHVKVGETWHQVAESHWAYLDAPLEHIRKVNAERFR